MSTKLKLTPTERALLARCAAHLLHAGIEDPPAHTAPARRAFDARFYAGLPEGLSEAERDRRAAHARSAYFSKLAFQSARARRERAGELVDR